MSRTPPSAGRLAAEFTVIVIGVLVALAADGWYSDLQERDAVRQSLIGIERELVEDSAGLARESARASRQIAAAERIIQLVSDETASPASLDELSDLLDEVSRSGPLVLTGGSYESLKTSRGLDVIEDAELRGLLIRYYDGAYLVIREIRRVAVENVVIGDFYQVLHRHTMPWIERNSPVFGGEDRPRVRLVRPMADVLADRELMSGVARVSQFVWYYQQVLDAATEGNAELLELVRRRQGG
jgi:hypothetical protein